MAPMTQRYLKWEQTKNIRYVQALMDLPKVIEYIYIKKGIYSVDFANMSNSFAFGGGDGIALVVSIS
jgi:hypothetical protein